jgi:hypothetical protein
MRQAKKSDTVEEICRKIGASELAGWFARKKAAALACPAGLLICQRTRICQPERERLKPRRGL